MRTIRVFAAVDRHQQNFGDNLMEPLLRELFGLKAVLVPPDQAELIGVGSILDYFDRHQIPSLPQRALDVLRGKRKFARRPPVLHVWGSGIISESGRAQWPYPISIHAVRGPLTRAKAGADDVPMGDPAVLLPRFWPRANKRAAVALVPHYRSREAFMQRYANDLPAHWRIVNAADDPRSVIDAISSADFVASSGLHGLIVADAYGVPNVWLEAEKPLMGDEFKFHDYAGSRGRPLHGRLSFPDFLKNHRALMASDLSAPATLGDEAARRLLDAFPFR